jgi:phospholipid-binding lipoprotein MlaA
MWRFIFLVGIFSTLLLFSAPGFAAETGSADQTVGKTNAEPFDPFAGEYEEELMVVYDPIEPFNRAMFWFNDKLYFYLLKPVARGFRIVPEPARVSVDNFFSNVATPVRFANSLLQFRFGDATRELGRFVVNSTWGVAGLFDPASKHLGWKMKNEDTGQTLGYFGVPSGFYLVLPVFGPSTPRDAAGRVGDFFLDPWNYVFDENWHKTAVKMTDRINALSLDEDTYESIKKEQLDPYLFIRDSYMQRREALIVE